MADNIEMDLLTEPSTKTKRVTGFFSKLCQRRWCLLIVVALMTLLVAVTILFIISINQNQSKEKGAQLVCIDCAQLEVLRRAQGKDQQINSLKIQGNKCCAENEQQLSNLLEIMLRRKDSPLLNEHPPSFYSLTNKHYSGHVLFKEVEVRTEEEIVGRYDGLHSLLFSNQTEEIDTLVEHVHGVKLSKYGFVIQHPGTYYVYSSVHFVADKTTPVGQCRKRATRTWGQYIYKHDATVRTPNILTKTVHTCCQECDSQEKTIYTGGVFLLKAGETVGVKITDNCLKNVKPESSYFGITMMGPD